MILFVTASTVALCEMYRVLVDCQILYFYFDGTWSGRVAAHRRPTPIRNEFCNIADRLSPTHLHTLIAITIIHLINIIVQNRFNILRMERQWIQSTVLECTSDRPMVLHSISMVCFHSSTNRHVREECNWITYRSVLGQLGKCSMCIFLLTTLANKILSRFRSKHFMKWTPMRVAKTINQITKIKTRTRTGTGIDCSVHFYIYKWISILFIFAHCLLTHGDHWI